MKTPGRRMVLLVSAALALLGAGSATTGVANAAPAGCQVTYTISDEVDGTYNADVTVAHRGPKLDRWTLSWAFVPGQAVTEASDAAVVQAGRNVTARGNRSSASNGTVTFGFTGSWTATNPAPKTFNLNGTRCTSTVVNGGTTEPSPTDTPCPTPSAPATEPGTRAAATPIKIWMAGDSTMQNPSGGVCPTGWGSQFGALFTSDATVLNRSVGGRSIQTWLYDPNVTSTANSAGECVINPNTYSTRWQEMLNSSTGMKAGDYLFIQFGINDGSTTCPRHVGSARFKQLLGVMAQAAIARGAHPIFLTSTAAITCSGSTATTNRGFITETFAAGTANNVPVIDLQKLSVALYNSLKFCPNNGDYTTGALGAFFCNDHTHFETEGARQIAGVVATALKNQGIPVASYLR